MNIWKLFILIILMLTMQNNYATTWYLENDDTLKNDDLPELRIRSENGEYVFYINNRKLPLAQKGALAPTTASAALIDSSVYKNRICIEAVMGANGKEQNIRNIYIIHNKSNVTAFKAKRSKITCESELKRY